MFAYLIKNTDTKGKNIIWSTHCHDDLGFATANSLAAVQHGARQIEVTLNSLGERAGNTSLEETVMTLRTRPQLFPVYCNIDTRQIMRTSKMVATYTGIAVQPNKAIVGANAFAHESGIHQHGVLKHSETYEIMTPQSVGIDGGVSGRGTMVLGKHSGKAAYKQRLIELGYDDVAHDEKRLENLVNDAKAVADKKKTISDQDLEALVGDHMHQNFEDAWSLDDLIVTSSAKGQQVSSTATVTLTQKATGEKTIQAATGVGPVDAAFRAILCIVDRPCLLTSYSVTKIEGGSGPDTPGNDALASVVTQVQLGDCASSELQNPADFPGSQGVTVYKTSSGEKMASPGGARRITYTGNGTSTDIIVASARAYISSINRMLDSERRKP